jgi:RNA polymerase-associated protein LEO1
MLVSDDGNGVASLLLLYRSPSVDDISEDDSDRARKKEGKQRKRDHREEASDDDRDNDYGSSNFRLRVENRASVQLPDIGFPYSSDNKVQKNLPCYACFTL